MSFEQIKAFYNNCRPKESLKPGDPRYVNLSGYGIRGQEEPRKMMKRAIELSEMWTSQLFTGFSGSGKSTELLLLEDELNKETSWAVVYQDTEELIDPTQPLHIVDVLVTLGSMADEALRTSLSAKDAEKALKQGFWERTKELLFTKVDIESINLKGPGGSLKGKLRHEPSFRRQVHENGGSQLNKLHQQCKHYIDDVTTVLKEAGKEGLVLILDSMEKISGVTGTTEKVALSIQETFFVNASFLTELPCHIIYTIPPHLHILEPNLGSVYGNHLQILPMCQLKDRSGALLDKGLEAFQEILSTRLELDALFGEQDREGLTQQLILASGGYPRDLLLLARHLLQLTDELPATKEFVEQAITKLHSPYRTAVLKDDVEWLVQIATSHQHDLNNEEHLQRLARLFRNHVVLCYYNGEPWYDLHPAIHGLESIKAGIQARRKESPITT